MPFFANKVEACSKQKFKNIWKFRNAQKRPFEAQPMFTGSYKERGYYSHLKIISWPQSEKGDRVTVNIVRTLSEQF